MECAPTPLRPHWGVPRTNSAINVAQRLATEIQRKLTLAAQSGIKDDAETLCEDIFVDLTGRLESKAQQILQTDRPCSFFEILADYYTSVTQLNLPWVQNL